MTKVKLDIITNIKKNTPVTFINNVAIRTKYIGIERNEKVNTSLYLLMFLNTKLKYLQREYTN